jgi:FKBP-type peptidyl-prolyl cis-trans isomerase 2
MKIENGFNIKVHYRGTLADGTEFDNSRTRGQTLDFEVGTPRLLKGFNDAVVGMTRGEKKTFSLTADEAYGQTNSEAFQVVPKTQFGENFIFEAGAPVMGNGPQGSFRATIREVHDNDVVLDFNHPLAGKDITFEVEVVSAEPPMQMANWSTKMKKAELFEIAKSQGLRVNTRSTKAQIIQALQA